VSAPGLAWGKVERHALGLGLAPELQKARVWSIAWTSSRLITLNSSLASCQVAHALLCLLLRTFPHFPSAGELRWDEVRAGRDLHVIDGLTVTKMSNEGGDYATVLGTLCVASGQHSWNVYINHVEDSNLFIGVTMGGHDLNADPQEMKSRTYYLSNGTIRVAGARAG
jgi:hypothetical protein